MNTKYLISGITVATITLLVASAFVPMLDASAYDKKKRSISIEDNFRTDIGDNSANSYVGGSIGNDYLNVVGNNGICTGIAC